MLGEALITISYLAFFCWLLVKCGCCKGESYCTVSYSAYYTGYNTSVMFNKELQAYSNLVCGARSSTQYIKVVAA
jgi:hypothetical protein